MILTGPERAPRPAHAWGQATRGTGRPGRDRRRPEKELYPLSRLVSSLERERGCNAPRSLSYETPVSCHRSPVSQHVCPRRGAAATGDPAPGGGGFDKGPGRGGGAGAAAGR